MRIMTKDNTNQSDQEKPKKTITKLPSQKDATDTSNWDDRVFNAPDGTTIIETDQTDKSGKVISE